MNPQELDFERYEETLLAMVLYEPSTLDRLTTDLFDNPGNVAVLEAMNRLHANGKKLTRATVQQAAGRWAHYVPEPWFTVGNIDFYLAVLERRHKLKVRRAELQDELKAIDDEVIVANVAACRN